MKAETKTQEVPSLHVDQQQVAERTSLRRWTETSVWSLVCAMELGLVTDRTSSDGDALTRDDVDGRGISSSGTKEKSSRKKRRNGQGRRRRKRVSKAAVTAWKIAGRSVNVRESTVEMFWKSCKRRLTRSKKPDEGSEEIGLEQDQPAIERSTNVAFENLESKRQRVEVDRDGDIVPQSDTMNCDANLRPSDSGNESSREMDPVRFTRNSTKIRDRRESTSTNTDAFDTSSCASEQRKERAAEEEEEQQLETKDEIRDEDDPENDRPPEPASPAPDFHEVRTLPLARRVSSGSGTSNESGKNESNSRRSCRTPAATRTGRRNSVKSETVRAVQRVFKRDEDYPEVRRVTRGSTKIGKDYFVGKLVWGFCSGWWPALIIDADHVGMLSEPGKSWVYWIGEARISLLNEKTQIEPFSSSLKARLTQNSSVPRIRAIDATMQMLRNNLGCPLTKPYSTWIEHVFSNTVEPLDEIKFYPYPAKMQQRLNFLKEKNAKVTEKYLLDQKKESQGKKVAEKPKESPQRNEVDLSRLPLREQHPGVIVWAKIAGHNWWPAMIIDYRDCCMREPNFGCQWIMWYGDHTLSQVHHQLFLRFDKGVEKMREYILNTKKHVYLLGVLQAAKDYCSRLGLSTDNWSLNDMFTYFSKNTDTPAPYDPPKIGDVIKIYDKYSTHIVEKLNEVKDNPNVDDKRTDDIKQSDDLRAALSGKLALQSLCLVCLKVPAKGRTEIHPFFEGSLCKRCSEQYKPRMFVFGNDSKCFYCTVCASSGMVIICDKEDCPRVYCTACMKHLLCPQTYEQVLREDPWECFVCRSKTRPCDESIVKPRSDWKEKIIDMFRTRGNSKAPRLERNAERRKIRVLSLFDGLSTGFLVLRKLGITVDVYYASEIDPDALLVSATHFGDRVIHLGDVRHITKEKIKEIAPIDLLIGGSPCNDLSLANPARLGLYDPNGTGILFFEYRRILDILRKINNGRRLFWLYENVASMPTEYRLEINRHLGQEPDVIDSADFSPQHRLRLYWHNLPIEPHSLPVQQEQDVQDILTPHCQRYALVKKIRTVTTKVNSLKQGKLALKPILMKDESDSLWITELEEIFGFPRHYTDVKNLSATKRQRLIGKSWSVQTLSAILRSLCPFFQCNNTETNVSETPFRFI